MKKDTFGDTLRYLREQEKLSVKSVIDELKKYNQNITDKTLYSYENNKRAASADMLLALCQIYNCNNILETFTDIVPDYSIPTDTEWNMIEQYRTLDPHGRDMVDTVLQKEVERMESLKKEPASNPTAHIYPYLGKIACAGTGFYFDDIPTDTIEAPYVEGADFIIGVSGESMEPDYHDGEKLYVRKVEYLRNGDVGIFTIGNECFLKELGEEGLISRNKDYDDIPGDEKVRLIGKVIGKVE